MNRARLALYPSLLLLANCASTELERKEATINTALAGAYVACTAALSDPRMTWAPGARDYCTAIVSGGCAK